ncbi:helix-turn-helix domain-containing protein [Paenibacillus sp. GCM10027629]|uniref:helix-turn-helix domain-containing protein n=1 Tax=Paenibacillus sp. GCM10027629 TaxID=3273414 RepID=UPI00363B4674
MQTCPADLLTVAELLQSNSGSVSWRILSSHCRASRLDLRYIGTSRITINKILQKWKHLRLFAFSNRSPIHITDIDKLREIINISELTQIL